MRKTKWERKTLVGLKYGRLTVEQLTLKPEHIKSPGRYWLCRCDCGKTTILPTGILNSGSTSSCGCLAEDIMYPDISGKKFGLLTVVKDISKRKPRSLWLCRCDCGREINARGFYLNRGSVKSCGCIGHSSRALGGGQGLKNKAVRQYQNNAKDGGLEWALSNEQSIALMENHCHYCGSAPSRTIRKPHCAGEFKCNGIDRKDNTKGYTVENTVPCCTFCNFKKSSTGYIEFAAWVDRVHRHWASGFSGPQLEGQANYPSTSCVKRESPS
jgi:hypothetical protein